MTEILEQEWTVKTFFMISQRTLSNKVLKENGYKAGRDYKFEDGPVLFSYRRHFHVNFEIRQYDILLANDDQIPVLLVMNGVKIFLPGQKKY